MAAELCAVVSPDRSIQLQGGRGDAGLAERIEIVDRPVPCGESTGVALVVNSAHEHREAVESVLEAGYHVVCEKPLTFSRDDSLRLLARAAGMGLKLFCTNTYLFADYLHVLRRDWLHGRAFAELELIWADATREVRHGEPKAYDSGVPVIFDVLPHVASIVLATHGPFTFERTSVAVAHGGSTAMTAFHGHDLTVRARISRRSERRTRLLRFSGPGGEVALDFTAEPGVVSRDEKPGVCVDPAWEAKRKPIAQMLDSVKTYFDGGALDDRLDAGAALLGNALTDAVAEGYVQQQIDFLSDVSSPDEDVVYAEKEAAAIRQRALSHLPHGSPLTRLATVTQPSRTLS